MKEKMNQADDCKDSDSSSDDSDNIQRKDSKLSTQVQTNVHPSSGGSGQFKSGSAGSSVQESAEKMIDNDLPEDKEIHSDNEEEEE